MTTNHQVATRLTHYLLYRMTLEEMVAWAEQR